MPNKRTDKIQILVDDEELEAIDEWRFEHHMPSRSAAVRALLHVALKSRGAKSVRPNVVVTSRDVGVVESSPALQAALGTGARKKILLVEDEYLIAAGLGSIVEDLGYDVVGPVSETRTALELIDRSAPDAAVLDIDLGKETSLGLAEILMHRRIPLLFCTGVSVDLPESLRNVPVVTKPHVRDEIGTIMRTLIPGGRNVA